MLRTPDRRHLVTALIGSSLCLLTAASPTVRAAGQSPAAARETRQRVVAISVVKDDTPVRDLKPAEVKVKEDGQNREVLAVAPALPPSHLVLLLDDSDVSEPVIKELRDGAASFLHAFEGNTPAPMVALWTFGERPSKVVDFTTNIALSGTASGKLFSRTGAGAYLLETILDVCKELKKAEAARPIIVAYVTEDGQEFSNDSHDRIADALREAGASLWVLVLQARVADTQSREMRERSIVLGDVVRDSGGFAKTILSRQSITPGFTALSNMISGRLDVTYGRTDMMIPPKKLEITVTRSGVKAYTPRWPRP
jgi:hypothetical protein